MTLLPREFPGVRVHRIWPRDADRLRMEGRDADGRVRAGDLRRTDSGWALRLLPYGEDPRLPDLARYRRPDTTVLVHRSGRRAVLRTPHDYVKVVRPGAGPDVLRAARDGARFAATLGWLAPHARTDGDAVRLTPVPGTPLRDVGSAPGADWKRAWARFAETWRSVLDAEPTTALPHDAEAEARVVSRWVGHAQDLVTADDPLHAVIRDLGRIAVDRLRDSRGRGDLVLAHRDLHDKQLLADGDRLGLIDADTLAPAERELDLANLDVHVDLRVAQGQWSAAAADTAHRAVTAAAGAVHAHPDRMAAYRTATRVRLGCLYLFRPDHESTARALLQDTMRELS